MPLVPYIIGGGIGLAVSGWAAFTSLAWIDEQTDGDTGTGILTIAAVVLMLGALVVGSGYLLTKGMK